MVWWGGERKKGFFASERVENSAHGLIWFSRRVFFSFSFDFFMYFWAKRVWMEKMRVQNRKKEAKCEWNLVTSGFQGIFRLKIQFGLTFDWYLAWRSIRNEIRASKKWKKLKICEQNWNEEVKWKLNLLSSGFLPFFWEFYDRKFDFAAFLIDVWPGDALGRKSGLQWGEKNWKCFTNRWRGDTCLKYWAE